MNIADYKMYDMLNGYGLRHSLFVSGCRHYCYNCFNKVAWNFNYGIEYTKEFENQLIKDLNNPKINISGLSILGGEPFENTKELINLVKRVKKECPDKDVWVWSGYTYEQLLKDNNRVKLLKLCDVLVDGKYIDELRDLNLKFRGSKNQRIVDIQNSLKQNKVIIIT